MNHSKCRPALIAAMVIILFNAIISFSAPIIQCDTQDVNVGTIREGEVKRLRHVFLIKNTGDETLIIQQVKPG